MTTRPRSRSRRCRCGWRISVESRRNSTPGATPASPRCASSCARTWRGSRPAPRLIRVVKVNQTTLSLFEAEDMIRLVANLDRVFRDDMLTTHLEELVQLWDGAHAFSGNARQLYALGAAARHPAERPCSARPRGRLGAGADRDRGRERPRERARATRRQRSLSRAACSSIRRFRCGCEDFSAIKRLIDEVRDLRHCGFPHLHRCSPGIRRSLHERDPRPRRQRAYVAAVRRDRQDRPARCVCTTSFASDCARTSASN